MKLFRAKTEETLNKIKEDEAVCSFVVEKIFSEMVILTAIAMGLGAVLHEKFDIFNLVWCILLAMAVIEDIVILNKIIKSKSKSAKILKISAIFLVVACAIGFAIGTIYGMLG